eukprot:6247291-Amphidinium_carterae.1
MPVALLSAVGLCFACSCSSIIVWDVAGRNKDENGEISLEHANAVIPLYFGIAYGYRELKDACPEIGSVQSWIIDTSRWGPKEGKKHVTKHLTKQARCSRYGFALRWAILHSAKGRVRRSE